MEQIYFLEENYEEWIEFSHLIDFGTEGSIMSFGDEVIKLLHQNLNSITKYRLRKLESIDGLKEFITMPTKEIYYDYRFIGFAMKYAGINFRDVLIKHINDGTLTDNIKISHLKHIRDCLEALRHYNVIHGDIQPRNILIDQDKVLIGDINNCSFAHFRNPYFNEISKRLFQKYGLCTLIDLQTFNYFTYLIMNLSGSELESALNSGADFIWWNDIRDISNKAFDDEVTNMQLDVLFNKNNKKKALIKSDYLINHLR